MASSSNINESLDPRLRDSATYAQPMPHNLPAIAAHPSPAPPQQPYAPIYQGSNQNSYPPQTPQSGSGDNNGSDNDGNGDGSKRSRACEACRGLKVKCEPDPNNLNGDCKRCAKAGRTCVVTVASRKRQKKTDSRVAELEKKIDALTESLKAKSAPHGEVNHTPGSYAPALPSIYQQPTNGGYNSPFPRPDARAKSTEWSAYPKVPEFEQRKPSAPPMVMAGQKRKHADSSNYSASPVATTRTFSDGGIQQHGSSEMKGAKKPQTHEYSDVVDRGLLTPDEATVMFNCYVERMAPHLPAVIFPKGTPAADIRKSKPALFLAILAASSGMNYPHLQRSLTKEIMSIYAERIIINGEKTLELIQSLQVSTLWYWPPEHFEELKFYQLIHIAAVMGIDIGIGKKSKSPKAKHAGLWRDHPWRRTPYPDPESPEARRAWMVCYFLCCNASMGLRRPNLIRWTPFLDNCLEFFATSPEAAPSDKVICEWVRNQHIAEEVGAQFSMDDPTATVSIADSKVQFAMKGFERDLEKWYSQVPDEARSPSLKMSHHVVSLYMHEVAMHVDHNVEEFKPPFTEDTLRGPGRDREQDALTPVHISALSSCLSAIDGIFETFFRFDVEVIRCLPIYNFIRVAYAVVVLIKMYFAAATPNSELGKVMDKDNMKVEQYLDNLVDVFKAAAAEEKSRPSAKFLMVLIMLKTWFHRQREGKAKRLSPPGTSTLLTGTVTEATGESDTRKKDGQQSFEPANTPLQLLSEVATDNSRRHAENGGQFSSGSIEWQLPAQGFDMNQFSTQQGYMPMSGNFDSNPVMDIGYTMGDGFEQAIGMTLGVGDFGYDDAFFGNLLQNDGSGFGGF